MGNISFGREKPISTIKLIIWQQLKKDGKNLHDYEGL